MDHMAILRSAWRTAWTYRALWIFGVILSLVTFSWAPYTILDRDVDREWEWEGLEITSLPGETAWQTLRRAARVVQREADAALSEVLADTLGIHTRVNVFVVVGVLLATVVLAIVLGKIARYVSETALIRMVGAYQKTPERLTLREGLRLGWSRRAWRLFLIDLVIDVLATAAVLGLFVAILAPLPLWVGGSQGVIFVFAFLTGALLLVAMAAAIVGTVVVLVTKRLARRACALEGLGVIEATRQGWRKVRRYRRDLGLMWFVAAAVRVGWALVTGPVVLLLIAAALLLGGLPGVAAGGLAERFTTEDTAVMIGLLLGVPLFLLIFIGPLLLLEGLREVFLSTLWTLTYNALPGLERVETEPVRVPSPPSLQASPAA